jgi:farnesol dehydrogenase
VRVLVTGGTGYLGRAIVHALVRRGHEPVVFARQATRAGLPGRAVDGDVRDARALIDAARGSDAICHTAALVKVWSKDPHEFDEVNIGGLEHALAAVKELQLTRFVYTSSFLALPPAGHSAPLESNDYQRTKAAASDVARRAREAGAPIVTLYPGLIYGPGIMSEGNLLGRMLADHVAGRLPGLIGADRIWSFAWVDDVAGAHVAALERASPGATYQLGGENARQILPFELVRDALGVKLPRRLPYWAAEAVGALEGVRANLTGRPPRLTRRTVEIFRCDWPSPHDAAVRDLEYHLTPLSQGMARTIAELGQTQRVRADS